MAPRRRESDGELFRDLCSDVGLESRLTKTLVLTCIRLCSVRSGVHALPLVRLSVCAGLSSPVLCAAEPCAICGSGRSLPRRLGAST